MSTVIEQILTFTLSEPKNLSKLEIILAENLSDLEQLLKIIQDGIAKELSKAEAKINHDFLILKSNLYDELINKDKDGVFIRYTPCGAAMRRFTNLIAQTEGEITVSVSSDAVITLEKNCGPRLKI